jgi:hypothetical protein
MPSTGRKAHCGADDVLEERITAEEAIRCCILNSVYAGFGETRKASLEVGKPADLPNPGADPVWIDPVSRGSGVNGAGWSDVKFNLCVCSLPCEWNVPGAAAGALPGTSSKSELSRRN